MNFAAMHASDARAGTLHTVRSAALEWNSESKGANCLYSLLAIRHSLYTHAMPIDYAALKSWPFPDVEHRYTARDAMLYALGLGCGNDPTDPDELQFVFEENLR